MSGLPSPRLPARLPVRAATHLAGALTVATAASLVPAAAASAAPTSARAAAHPTAERWPGHPDRAIVRYLVRPGDTATGLAVRYHAWTAELLRLNRLGAHAAIYRGQRLRIPIVISAMRRAGGHVPPFAGAQPHQQPPKQKPHPHVTKKKHTKKKHQVHQPLLVHTSTPPKGWRHTDHTRDEIRHLVSRMAHRYGVPRTLALAIAWQESGWQQRRVSSAGALGVMQVMPDTGRWMRWYAGRKLRLRDTHDNIQAGVMTLRILRSWTHYDNNAIAAYYQGLGAVREHGFFRDTRQYVRSVRAHQRLIIRTGSPI